jgi:4-hydroxy-tetrahydrodipicolinate synthase
MPANRNFSGVIAPVLTPFGEDGEPDADRYVEHCEWLLEDGCTALAPFGTTSEANSLSTDERMELLEILADSDVDPDKLMPGTGMCSLTDAIALTEHAVDIGCAGVLMLPPFYYKNPSEDGLFRFFAEVIEDIGDDDLKIYLYHIPPVAQVGFSLPLIGRLLKAYPNTIAGLKDSTGDWNVTKSILDAYPQLKVFPGSEAYLLDALQAGAAGCISATANINAKMLRSLFDTWRDGDAAAKQERIKSFRMAAQAYPMIPLLKSVIGHYRDDAGWREVRPPFMPMTEAEADAAVKALADKTGFKLEFPDD